MKRKFMLWFWGTILKILFWDRHAPKKAAKAIDNLLEEFPRDTLQDTRIRFLEPIRNDIEWLRYQEAIAHTKPIHECPICKAGHVPTRGKMHPNHEEGLVAVIGAPIFIVVLGFALFVLYQINQGAW